MRGPTRWLSLRNKSQSVERESTEAGNLTVFHGTRLSAARTIEQSGFNPVPVGEQIAAMAAAHGVALDDLLGI